MRIGDRTSSGSQREYTFDLSKARTGKEITVLGHYIKIVEATDAAASVKIAVQHNIPSKFRTLNNDGMIYEGQGFTKFFITNEVQTGKELTVIISNGPDDYDVQNATQNVIQEIVKPVITQGGTEGTNAAVSVGTTATQILSADADRTGYALANMTAGKTVFLGTTSGVTATNGFPLNGGDKMSWNGRHALYGIVQAGTADIRKIDQGTA